MSEDIKSNEHPTCRICLSSNLEKCMSLFENYKNSFVYNHIMSISNISISENDGLPSKICPRCLLDLETALTFKQRCEDSDRLIRNSCNSFQSTDKTEFDIEKEETNLDDFVIKKEEEDDYLDANCDYLDGIDESISDFNIKPIEEQLESFPIKNEKQLPNAYQCQECMEFFKSKCKLRVHWKRKHLQKIFVCENCRRLFKTSAAYEKHKNIYDKTCFDAKRYPVRIEGEGKSRIFNCTECSYVTNRVLHIKQHSQIHKGVRWQCDLCIKSYSQRGQLYFHKKMIHSNLKTTIPCDVCGKLLKSTVHLRRHLETHSTNRYQCDHCKLMLKSKKSLEIHLKRHSGSKEYTCEVCGAAFFNYSELYLHKKRHLGIRKERIVKCPRCEYKTATKWQMIKHLKHHDDTTKPFNCNTCGRFFETQHSLQIHETRHLESHKFQCPMCKRNFIRKKYLLKHIRTKHNVDKLHYTETLVTLEIKSDPVSKH